MPYGSNLTGNSATDDAHSDVESIACACQMKRLEERSLIDGSATKIVSCGTAIHSDPSGSGIEPDSRHRSFSATYCPDVWGLSHGYQTFPSVRITRWCQLFGLDRMLDQQRFGLLRRVRMIGTSVNLEFPELATPKDIPG